MFSKSIGPAIKLVAVSVAFTILPACAEWTGALDSTNVSSCGLDSLDNLEMLMNMISGAVEFLGLAWGGPTVIMALVKMAKGSQAASKNVFYGLASVSVGLAAPACIGWILATLCEAALFD